MSGTLGKRTIDSQALAQIERRLHGRLRAHHISESFIGRTCADAIQKGIVEYLRAEDEGREIREPRAFIVQAAFRRAIDELRRETRSADGSTLEDVLESGRRAAAPAEEVAIENLEAQQLQTAIESLPAEERQVLALHFFDGMGQREAADLLYMSERTFRRRLRHTLAELARALGAPAPEPGSHRGLEIGVAAWASLGGGQVVMSSGPIDHLVAALDSIRRVPERILERLRGHGTRLAGSEAPERISMIAGGPAGKVIGGCAGAAVVCAISGVVGPGLDLGSGGPASHPPPHIVSATRRHPAATRPIVVPSRIESPIGRSDAGSAATSRTSGSSTAQDPARRHPQKHHVATAQVEKEAPVTEAEAAEEQFSGVVKATTEAEPSETSSSSGSVAQSTPAPAASSAESSRAKTEERQTEEQFRGPLAR